MGGWRIFFAVLPVALCACTALPPRPGLAPPGGHRLHSELDLIALEAAGRPTDWSELTRLTRETQTFPSLMRQAFLFQRVGRPERAREVLDRALLLGDLSSQARALVLYGKARVYRDLGERLSADQARRSALALQPDPLLRKRLEDLASLEPEQPEGGEHIALEGLALHSRKKWGAAPTELSLAVPMGRIWRLTIHHTGIPCPDTTPAGVASQIRSIQNTHRGQRWADMGYHFLIDPVGEIWEGRPLTFQGAHAGSAELNRGNIGVCMLGDLHTAPPTAAQAQTLDRLARVLIARYRIASSMIFGHRDLKPTLCPGEYGYRLVTRLRSALR